MVQRLSVIFRLLDWEQAFQFLPFWFLPFCWILAWNMERMKLFVGSLDYNTDEKTLKQVFGRCGTVDDGMFLLCLCQTLFVCANLCFFECVFSRTCLSAAWKVGTFANPLARSRFSVILCLMCYWRSNFSVNRGINCGAILLEWTPSLWRQHSTNLTWR